MALNLATFVLILVGGSLDPGWVEPRTHRVRFISDGFRDYRALPWIAVGLIVPIVALLWHFSYMATLHSHPHERMPWMDHRAVFVVGLASVVGFLLLSSHPSGPVHLAGAATFVFFYTVLHYCLDVVLWRCVCPYVH